jgi:hypothetical protein
VSWVPAADAVYRLIVDAVAALPGPAVAPASDLETVAGLPAPNAAALLRRTPG